MDPKTGGYDFQFHAAGLRLDNLQAVKARNMEISGAANVDLSGAGTVEQPQQRVTSNLFLTLSTDVTSTQRQSIQLEYDLNARWSVTGVRDQNGGVTALGHYKKKF